MSFLKNKRSVTDIWPIKSKTVLIRVDFNVPIRNGVIAKGGDARIKACLPTIRRVIDQGGKAVLLSHMVSKGFCSCRV
jgi:phosphoglycerate kinase